MVRPLYTDNRGANGVIFGNNKKVQRKENQHFDFTYNYGFQSPTKVPEMLERGNAMQRCITKE